MAGRPIIAIVSLILLAGGLLLEFFIILAGATGTVVPENKLYFLSIDTAGSGIPNLPNAPRVAWSYYGLATQDTPNGDLTSFLGKHPAFPFDPVRNFGLSADQESNLAPQFINTNYYYYMSRFAWVFYLVALFFAVIALFTGLLAICSRIGGYLSGLMTSIATFFMAIAAALMTAWSVKARNNFNSFQPNTDARLGRYMYGFTWAAFACYFLSMILFCVSGASGGRKETTYKERKGFFGRSKSTRNPEGVKSEYS